MTGQRNPGKHTSSVHELKVQLEGTEPRVWRRVVVPSDLSRGSLHDVIQVAFGWRNTHLHVFEDHSGGRYGPRDGLGGPALEEENTVIVHVLPRTGDRVDYTYGFGDDWLHRITVDEVGPAGKNEGDFTLCTGGRRAMPAAEDLGGVCGLAELLQRYADGERPRPTVVRHGGAQWAEYDGLRKEMPARLYEEGFDPVVFGPGEVTRALAEVRLQRAGRGERSGRPASAETYLCACGDLHLLPGDVSDRPTEEQSLPGLFGIADVRLPAVRLPGESELAGAVREVPVFMAAMRLARWCGGGRELTPNGLLRPKLAPQAVEEAELWRIAPAEWGDPRHRAARLARIRSAGGMELLDLPWGRALKCGFVKVEGGRAYAGEGLPDEDAELLAAWQEAMTGTTTEISLTSPLLEHPLGGLTPLRGLMDEAPALVFLMLIAAYRLPDGEWLDVADYLTDGLEGLPEGPARQLVAALLAEQYDDTAATLELFGAVVREDDRPVTDGALALLLNGGGRDPQPAGRFRLTPLGRSGLRRLLAGAGTPTPVTGSLARADARELPAALPSYPNAASVTAELAGWLACRSAADAAVQVVDACGGTEPADALRRLEPPRVLAAVLKAHEAGRAKPVLRKAAVSRVTGCAHAAASMLRRVGEPAEGQAAWGLEWMLVDGVLPFARRGEQALGERLLAGPETNPRPLDQVAERADDLWRAGHPHTGEVLVALADAVKPVDRALAKRLRKASFKGGSST
ncbi:hypothetical protein ACH47Z_42665 [Streptomyces sp. NPDC020192]|uniref:IS1096 element passenger TnpR family protein n=1 Tax=Streptomyces sp. NPDC020192 TaxID=3365066 RepID=UPI0037B17F09